MSSYFSALRPFIHKLDPERAHQLAIAGLSHGLIPSARIHHDSTLETKVLGLHFKNPIGLAAGFDKNAEVVNALLSQGFGFVEAGTVTPRPQSGNPKPRIFRLTEDEAIINRLGFNNLGLDRFVWNLHRRQKIGGIVGANIGKNKDSEDAVEDYVTGLRAVYAACDYVTINISSPNTKGLRDLQQRGALGELLAKLMKVRGECALLHNKQLPLLLKVAPDLEMNEKEDIAELAMAHKLEGLIISNTTISRPDALKSQQSKEQGGLSGRPLFALSTAALADFYRLTNGRLLLVGVGGVSSAADAYAKIRSGASLVQLYSALVYQGFSVVQSIVQGLPALIKRDGFTSVSQAIGADHR
ncbi:MAG: quinone-dependent dihydroorotate dehydrogenase [Rickettsiales bacterium]|jgi:dihydroorotate dehydrogenase|nr:quinone-dependent dihydroorotate dehydrogenase [Rickettsiales bacterium]